MVWRMCDCEYCENFIYTVLYVQIVAKLVIKTNNPRKIPCQRNFNKIGLKISVCCLRWILFMIDLLFREYIQFTRPEEVRKWIFK